MSRQYFMDLTTEPILADILTFSTVTTEGLLWPVATITPIAANEARAGKMYKVTAGGIITMPASTGSITINPRWGLTTAAPLMGSSVAQFSAGATTNRPWYMEVTVLVRTVGASAGANSTAIAWGFFCSQTVSGVTATPPLVIPFGGTSVSVDVGIATGIAIGWIWGTTAGSITTQGVAMQSVN